LTRRTLTEVRSWITGAPIEAFGDADLEPLLLSARRTVADLTRWARAAWPLPQTISPSFPARYLAEEPIGAFVEKFGRLLRPGGVIPEPLVDTQRLSRLRPPKVSVVDLTAPKVLGHIGLTAEIHATTDYGLTQSWTIALRDAGHPGRSDPQSLHHLRDHFKRSGCPQTAPASQLWAICA